MKVHIVLTTLTLFFAALLTGHANGDEPRISRATTTEGSPPARVLRVALVQSIPELDQNKNREKGDQYCRAAKSQGADVVVFPEMFSLGYYTDVDFDDPAAVAAWKKLAVTVDSPFITHFQQLARELDIAIAITYLENRDGELRNSTTLFDRHGKRLYTYSKVHTCSFFKMEGSLVRGDEFYVAELDTRVGPVQTGIMTCYDREFPESARILMLKGAEIILTPNACRLRALRINQFQVRAWENSVVTAMANYAEGQGNGHSCVFHANGEELLMAGESEGVFTAEIDLDELRKIRKKTFWGNAWRHPDRYRELLSTEVEDPFVRTDAFGRANDR